MAVTVTPDSAPGTDGNRRQVYANVTFDSTYPAGGEVLDPAGFGLTRLDEVTPLGPSTNGYVASWFPTTKKLKLHQGGTAVSTPQAENTTANVSAETVRVRAVGI